MHINMLHVSFVLIIVSLQLAYGFYPKTLVINDELTASKWKTASQSLDAIAWWQKDVFISFLEDYFENVSSQKLSLQCRNSLRLLKSGLEHREIWSYECKLIHRCNC